MTTRLTCSTHPRTHTRTHVARGKGEAGTGCKARISRLMDVRFTMRHHRQKIIIILRLRKQESRLKRHLPTQSEDLRMSAIYQGK